MNTVKEDLFTELLKGNSEIDAICLATAFLNNHTIDQAVSCEWVNIKGKNPTKSIGCPDCPFISEKAKVTVYDESGVRTEAQITISLKSIV